MFESMNMTYVLAIALFGMTFFNHKTASSVAFFTVLNLFGSTLIFAVLFSVISSHVFPSRHGNFFAPVLPSLSVQVHR